MRKIGDKVVYSSYGVMEIVDIREETVLSSKNKYYILESVDSFGGSQTFVPVENEQLVAKMRPLIEREALIELIRSLDDIPEAKWIPENRARAESFRQTIESGDHIRIISMIKLIKKTGERRVLEGKKNYLADENAMNKAKKLLYSEFATVLSIDESEVPDFIERERLCK